MKYVVTLDLTSSEPLTPEQVDDAIGKLFLLGVQMTFFPTEPFDTVQVRNVTVSE